MFEISVVSAILALATIQIAALWVLLHQKPAIPVIQVKDGETIDLAPLIDRLDQVALLVRTLPVPPETATATLYVFVFV